MKFNVIAIAALSAIAAAQPHQRLHHKHRAAKRQGEVDVVTQTDIVTVSQPAVVVLVDEYGNPVSTSYGTQALPTNGLWGYPSQHKHHHHHTEGGQQPTPTSENASPTNYAPQPSATDNGGSPDYSSQAPAPSSYSPPGSAASSPPAPSSSSGSGGSGGSGSGSGSFGYGISYSGYNADSSCKSQDQVNSDFDSLPDSYAIVRIYGTDCNQASTVLSAAKSKGMQVFAGIYDISEVESETNTLIDAAQGDWSAIHTVSVGNEAINSGTATVDEVVSAVKSARSLLRAAGYSGPVVNVDVFDQVIANPALCQVSDYAAANCHAFFNSDLTADQAGPWVAQQAQRVKDACGGMDTVITESGWPSQGDANGNAVPSEANQKTAINSLKGSFSNNIVLFEAFNDHWKTNTAATFDAEQYWGIYGNAPS